MTKAVVLVSGGVDSTTLLHYVVKELKRDCQALTILYGQKHSKEIDCSKYQCNLLNVPFEIIDLSFLAPYFSSSSLVRTSSENIPDVIEVLGDPQPSTYVPNRNMIFLSIAAAYAENLGIREVYYGAQRHDLYCLDSESWAIDKILGPIKLKDIEPGQEIIDMDGGTTIVNKIDKEIVSVYAEIHASGMMYRCSFGHDIPIVNYDYHSWLKTWQNHRISWMPAEYVKPGMFTVMPLKIENIGTIETNLSDELELKLWYVTEGCYDHRKVDIGQSAKENPENYARIVELIEKVGYKAWKSSEVISFSRNASGLFEGLGTRAINKRLPKEVFKLSYDDTLAALDILIKGDGYYRNSKYNDAYYFTSSEQLAQDIVTLALSIGIPAKPQKRDKISGNIPIHLPSLKPLQSRPRSFGNYQAVKINSVDFIQKDLEVARLETSTGTYLGGNIGFLGQSNGYWDTTSEFLDRINSLFALNRKNGIQILAPFVDYSKADVIRKGLELGVDYAHTWSDYFGREKASRRSATSAERLKAFAELGLTDPLEYED